MGREFDDFFCYNKSFFSMDDFYSKKELWLLLGCVDSPDICRWKESVVFIQKSGVHNRIIQEYPFFYPANAKCRFFAQYIEPCTPAWQRMLTFDECQIVGFDVTKSRGTSIDTPFIFSNGDPKYLKLKNEHDKVLSNFSRDCWHYAEEAWPIRLNYRVPSAEWVPRDEYKEKYHAYLKSPKWYAKRDARFAIDDWQCVRCGSAEEIQCHHVSRERMFNEELTDLVTMCKRCHHSRHENDLRRKGRLS